MMQKEKAEREFLDKFEREENQKSLVEASYDDILYSTQLYEKILEQPDEIAVSQYITALRQIAKRYKLTADFDVKVKPYRDKALKRLKQESGDIPAEAENCPCWWEDNNVNEDKFCEEILVQHKLYCINGFFYDMDGEYSVSQLSRDIYERIKAICKEKRCKPHKTSCGGYENQMLPTCSRS
jgi:putative DNA primase/helicase